jgi:hypothetical protein
MKAHTDWYEGIHRRIGALKDQWSPAGWRRYRLSLFVRVARRVSDFSTECPECRDLKDQISNLDENSTPSSKVYRKKYRIYLATFKTAIKHLRRKHDLVEDRQYIKRFVPFGIAFGLSFIIAGYVLVDFGITMLTISLTLPALFTRILSSYAFGYLLDRRAKKQGRVI